MNPEQYQHIKELYQAVAGLPPADRPAFLDEACKDEPQLRAEVEALLAQDTDSDELYSPHSTHGEPVLAMAGGLEGTRIGQFRIKRVISSGGMGTVYEALQEHPRRAVAVKVLKSGIASRSAMRRFEYESQILGRLRHPGIAQVYEAGTHVPEGAAGAGETGGGEPAGVPYFAMEYIPNALTLNEYVRRKNLPTRDCLRLFMQACAAVHHGHLKGVIHRDLKPANILVDSQGQVKIIDFGVARTTDSDIALTTHQTEVGQILGTLQYMSPEQCDADPHDLDTRSDVYSLGVVLYELLCKQLPYDVRRLTMYEAVQRIRDEQPRRPSTVFRYLKGDMETIVLKALEKDRNQRYQSADELMRDIDRFLSGEPILARPPSMIYQLKVFARRNRVLVGGLLAVFAVLAASVVVSTSLYFRAESARAEAVREAEAAESINAFFNDMLAAVDPLHLDIVSGFLSDSDQVPERREVLTRDTSIAEMIRFAAERIDERFAGKPVLKARIHETIGTTFTGLGLFKNAEPHLEAALAARIEHLGKDHLDTLRVQVQLGNLLRWIEEPDRAVSLLRPALEGMRHVFGPENRQTLVCQCFLASALSVQGKTDESNALFRRTLEAQQRCLGKKDRATLLTMCEWSNSLFFQNRNRESYELALQACTLSRSELGSNNVVTNFAEIMVGWCQLDRGESEKTEKLFRDLVDKSSRILGKEHRSVIVAMTGLALSLQVEDDYREIEDLLKSALASARTGIGEGSIFTGASLVFLADLLAVQGRHAEIEDLFRERLRLCREEFGDEDPDTLESLGNLASLLLNLDRRDEALAVYREWVDTTALAFGGRHPAALACMASAAEDMVFSGIHDQALEYASQALAGWRWRVEQPLASAADYSRLARFLLTCEPDALRDPKEALELAKKADDLCAETDPDILETLATAYLAAGDSTLALEAQEKANAALPSVDSAQTRAAMRNTVRILLRQNRDEEAARILDEMLARVREKSGETQDLLGLGGLFLEYSQVLIEEGRFEAAESSVRRSIEYFSRCLWIDRRVHLPIARTLLGRCLAGQGHFEEAESLLLQGYGEIEGHPFVPPGDKRQVEGWIVSLYEDWGKPDKAEEWRAKLP